MNKQEFIESYKMSSFPMGVLIRMAPKDKLNWKPTDKSWTLGQLLHHCSGTPSVFQRVIDNSWPSREEMNQSMTNSLSVQQKDGETAAKDFESAVNKVVEKLGQITETDYNNKPASTPWGITGSLGKVLQGAADHQNTHKTELYIYLKLLGLPVNTGTLYIGKSF